MIIWYYLYQNSVGVLDLFLSKTLYLFGFIHINIYSYLYLFSLSICYNLNITI